MSNDVYTPENVPLFEAMYGPGLISLGGYEAIDQMVKDVGIKAKHLLDVGSGIGGMAHYLAENYGAHVTGLVIYSWMADYAAQHAPESIKNNVNFITYTGEGLIPLPAEAIDMVCSKGVLTNVSDKGALFRELHRVLKPSGQLLLIDWIVPEAAGPQAKTLPTGEASHKETQSSYTKILSDCGFVNITFTNESQPYLRYAQNLDAILVSDSFYRFAGSALQDMLIASNLKLIKDIQSGDQLSVRIRGEKVRS